VGRAGLAGNHQRAAVRRAPSTASSRRDKRRPPEALPNSYPRRAAPAHHQCGCGRARRRGAAGKAAATVAGSRPHTEECHHTAGHGHARRGQARVVGRQAQYRPWKRHPPHRYPGATGRRSDQCVRTVPDAQPLPTGTAPPHSQLHSSSLRSLRLCASALRTQVHPRETSSGHAPIQAAETLQARVQMLMMDPEMQASQADPEPLCERHGQQTLHDLVSTSS
jgi:hypothetical protein